MKKEELLKIAEAMPDGSDIRVSEQVDAFGVTVCAEYDFTFSRSLGDSEHFPMFVIRKKGKPVLRHEKDICECDGVEIVRTHEGNVCGECGRLKR